MLISSAILSRTCAVGVGFLLNSISRVVNWSWVARWRFWFFCCCVRVLLRGGRLDCVLEPLGDLTILFGGFEEGPVDEGVREGDFEPGDVDEGAEVVGTRESSCLPCSSRPSSLTSKVNSSGLTTSVAMMNDTVALLNSGYPKRVTSGRACVPLGSSTQPILAAEVATNNRRFSGDDVSQIWAWIGDREPR
jgi:hypothetical protein